VGVLCVFCLLLCQVIGLRAEDSLSQTSLITDNPELKKTVPPPKPSETIESDLHLKLEDHQIEAGIGVKLWNAVRLGTRTGFVTAAGSFLGGPPIPYATLKPSLYTTQSAQAGYQGKKLDTTLRLTFGAMEMNSEQSLTAPGVRSRSFQQMVRAESAYGDVIGIFPVAEKAALAAFVGAEAWEFHADNAEHSMEMNAGSALATRVGQSSVFRLTLQGTAFLAKADSFQNVRASGHWNGAIRPGQLQAGADYTTTIGGNKLRLGVDAIHASSYDRLIPQASLSNSNGAVSLQGELTKSRNVWFPNSHGVSGRAVVPVKDFDISLEGKIIQQQAVDFDRGDFAFQAVGGLAWTPGKSDIAAKTRAQRVLAQEDTRYPSRSPIDTFLSQSSSYNEGRLKNDLKKSRDFQSFARNINANSVEDIITAVAVITYSQVQLDYNFDEHKGALNVDNSEKLYKRWKESFISQNKDPILVCIGAAEFASELVNAWGRLRGINITAAPISVVKTRATDPLGDTTYGMHSVPAIRTQEYGIVFVDWGQIIPTQTLDTRAALQMYQATQGVPTTIHYLGNPNERGQTSDVIFSPESEVLLDAVTLHGDPDVSHGDIQTSPYDGPRGSQITRTRALDALDRALNQ